MKAFESVELVGAIWFGIRLALKPYDRGLRVIVVALFLFFTHVAIIRLISDDLTLGLAKLLQNIALTGAFYAVMVVFLLSSSGTRYRSGPVEQRTRVPRRAWWDGLAAVAVCAVLTAAMAATPAPLQAAAHPASGRLQDAALNRPEVIIFYGVAVAYFVYASTCSAVWAVRYGRESSSRVRLGLRLAAAGMVLFALGSAGRGVYVVLRGLALPAPTEITTLPTSGITAGAMVWIAGLLTAGIAAQWAAGRVWFRRRRDWRALHPLWELLHRAFPEDSLDHAHDVGEVDSSGHEPGRLAHHPPLLGRAHRAYWRRAVEIRDGLSKLSPWLRDVGYRAEASLGEQAAAVRRALEIRDSGHAPTSHAPLLIAAPSDTTTVDDDVAQLVLLSEALNSHGR